MLGFGLRVWDLGFLDLYWFASCESLVFWSFLGLGFGGFGGLLAFGVCSGFDLPGSVTFTLDWCVAEVFGGLAVTCWGGVMQNFLRFVGFGYGNRIVVCAFWVFGG